VPLLKTTQVEIVNWVLEHRTLGDKTKDFLVKAAAFMKASAFAFAGAFKAKYTQKSTGISIEFEASKFLKEIERRVELQNESLFSDYDSVYYEFQKHLSELTSSSKPGLRLLFLIDDLDRCLPEKAVEMLESIKLFLDVKGCAFVLALDDEVVERGIIHRYRDYLFQQGNGAEQNGYSLAHLPITGQEYLEKIVQLPFRLPQPTRDNIRLFLQQREPGLFGKPGEIERDNNVLLDLFADCIPPVPRKLIRAVELLKLLLDILDTRKKRDQYQLLPLAKLTLLQLFAPDLYRFGRRYDAGFMQRLENWVEYDHWGMDDFIGRTECEMLGLEYQHVGDTEKRDAKFSELEKAIQNDLRLFRKNDVRLYQHFEVARQNRSGFDPERLICSGSIAGENLTPYFSFLEDVIPEQEDMVSSGRKHSLKDKEVEWSGSGLVPETDGQSASEDSRPLARIHKLDDFLNRLFSTDKANWQSALQSDEMDGRVLDDQAFTAIRERLRDDSYSGLASQADWLRALDKVLTGAQFQLLAQQMENFAKVFPEIDVSSLGVLSNIGLWVVELNRDRKQLLESNLQPIRSWALDIVENGKLEPEKRAAIGDILGQVGDSRFYDEDHFCLPRQFQGEKEKNHGFIEMPAGKFVMGKDDEKHEVTISDSYGIARYPVTVAQYACYVDQEAETPDDWQKQLLYPNRPVTRVSWKNAHAYCAWLKERLLKKGVVKAEQFVRLLTEAEWERAARSGDRRIYPWGNDWDSNRANAAGEIGHPSAVGMYPRQHPEGIQDMAGNVWEWTCSNWCNEFDGSEQQCNNNTENTQKRVLRGGSWSDHPDFLRAAARGYDHPDLRLNGLGFRVSSSSPIE
jgi:formylglycine-generating enzyme required for sulfatase activity